MILILLENLDGRMSLDLDKLHTNQRLLVKELQNRGVEIYSLVPEMELLEAKLGKHKEFLLDRDSSITPYASSIISGNKFLTKKLLERENISVPKGEEFFYNQIDNALVYAQEIGFPIVAKPTFGSHGYNVHMGLENLISVKDAIENIKDKIGIGRPFLLEEEFQGKEYRVFFTKNGDYAVLHRDPAHVIGNGKKTIEDLAKGETFKRMNPRTNCLCPIMIDETAINYLANQKLNLDSVPKKNEKVYLRPNSNVAMGGVAEDYTDKIHHSVLEVAEKTLHTFNGLPYVGIDYMSSDITKNQTEDIYRIIEVNSIPGIHMHMRPGKGKSRNVAKYMADLIFPETKR